ncbi:tetratricopeptide repeat protein [Kribbella lupini]|uniref:Tetratricopeptide repeat protein n=1 Tax=Kribbella lupini TaxID=291602 RepID=A0ABN2CKT7_9ACTN
MDDRVELRGPEDAERLIERGREAGALAALRVARDSVTPTELPLVADGFGQLEHWEEAAGTLRRATELQPEEARTWEALGDALVLSGRLTEAMVAYQEKAWQVY